MEGPLTFACKKFLTGLAGLVYFKVLIPLTIQIIISEHSLSLISSSIPPSLMFFYTSLPTNKYFSECRSGDVMKSPAIYFFTPHPQWQRFFQTAPPPRIFRPPSEYFPERPRYFLNPLRHFNFFFFACNVFTFDFHSAHHPSGHKME